MEKSSTYCTTGQEEEREHESHTGMSDVHEFHFFPTQTSHCTARCSPRSRMKNEQQDKSLFLISRRVGLWGLSPSFSLTRFSSFCKGCVSYETREKWNEDERKGARIEGWIWQRSEPSESKELEIHPRLGTLAYLLVSTITPGMSYPHTLFSFTLILQGVHRYAV